MIVRKLFKFESAHIVRGCSTERCKYSIHGHSYKAEILIASDTLDNGQMIMDFGLMKGAVKEVIDSFDHAIVLWSKDDNAYIEFAKSFSRRWVSLPVSPSAEQFSRVFFVMIDALLGRWRFLNGEVNVSLQSVIVHETDTGYAQCFKEDAFSPKMGDIDLSQIEFSEEVKKEWSAKEALENILKGEK